MAVAWAAAGGAPAATSPQYALVDLGSQEQFDWVHLNDKGEVSGEMGFPFGRASVRRPNGSIVTFPPFAPYERSEAMATNNGGTTVGIAAFQTTTGAAGAVWESTGTTLLGDRVVPMDVNDAGQIVGSRFVVDRNLAFLWEAGAFRDLELFASLGITPFFVQAQAVNERGDAVGRGQDAFGVWPLLWPAGVTQAVRLGRHQSSFSNTAADINDDGVAVGTLEFRTSPTRTIPVATKWVGGLLQHLPTLSGVDGRFGRAVAINDRGEIVGTAEELVPSDVGQVAALWTEDGVEDLNTIADVPPGLVLVEAIDINDRGQILALAHDPSTYPTRDCCGERFFLLTPPECEPISEEQLAAGDAGEGLPDADGDAIPDCWEEEGIPVETEDGDLLSYRLPGADPERKDLYVEVDHMVGLAPEPGALEDVVAAFAAAPVGNPDGSSGITLHVEVDDAVPHVPGLGFQQGSGGPGPADDFWDLKSGGAAPCDGFFGSGPERSDELCAAKLGAKRLVYRYAIFGDTYGSPDNEGSGIAECGTAASAGCAGRPGNDFLVTIGHHWDESEFAQVGGRRAMEAGAFMHELGHTVALDHGGGDTVNCKPNYVSAMNYSYVLVPTAVNAGRLLDYSGWASSLDETNLDEASAPGGPAGAVVFGWGGLWWFEPAAGGVDWNRDGAIGTASANINHIDALSSCRRPPTLPVNKVDGNVASLEALGSAETYSSTSVPAPTAFAITVCAPPSDSFCDNVVTPTRVEILGGSVYLTLPVTAGPQDSLRAFYTKPEENPLLIARPGGTEPEVDGFQWQLDNLTDLRETLHGFDDWANLKYNVRDAEGFADLAGSSPVEPEITAGEVRAVAAELLAQLDDEPPAVTAVTTPAANAAGWHSGPVTLRLHATDDGSGVEALVYDLGGPQVTVPGDDAEIVVSAEGVTTVTYSASDRRGNASEPQTLVVRIDTTAPALSCRATPSRLWPPNHKLVDVTVGLMIADALSGPSVFAHVSATSSEPDDGLGDGDTSTDIQGWQPGTADLAGKLRAERSGKGSGRVYSLVYEARDNAGNLARCVATAVVPRNG